MLEVCAAVAGAIGAERTGLRLSPYNSFLSAQDSVERAIDKNVWLMKELDSKVPGLAYIHMVSTATEAQTQSHSIAGHSKSPVSNL
jgi:N-acetylglucosamine kinase-like BadF-type ATPase